MSVIYVLLTISLFVAVIFFIAFIASVKSGQYDDTYTPSVRMLFEDELVRPANSEVGPDFPKDKGITSENKAKNEKSDQGNQYDAFPKEIKR